jgi:hypothetical protein
MIRIAILLFVAAVFALLPASAAAQRIDSPYRFVEHRQTLSLIGAHIDTEVGAVGLGPQAGNAFGVRYGIRFGGPFSGEVDVFAVPTTRVVKDTVLVMGEFREHGEANATLLAAIGSLRFNLTGARTFYGIQPHVIFGGGAVLNLNGSEPLDEEVPQDARFRFGTSFAGQFGGGAEWFVTDRLSLRGDARAVLWRLRTPDAFRLGGRADDFPADEWTRNTYFGLGVGYHF